MPAESAKERHRESPNLGEKLTRNLELDWPIDLFGTLRPLAHGSGDPSIRFTPDGLWWATRSVQGPVVAHLRQGAGEISAEVLGAGAEAFLDELPWIVGKGDDATDFRADAHPVMVAAFRQHDRGLRTLRTTRVLDALVPAIIEQRVTGLEANRAWRSLVRDYGVRADSLSTDAAMPSDLTIPPTAADWLGIPSWAWHKAGVDPGRAAVVQRCAQRDSALTRLNRLPPAEARTAIQSISGVGVWTAAEVAVRAWGDQDAVSFGDFHLAGWIVHALTGRRGGTDAEMAELLEPWAGQRARAVRLLTKHCAPPPRRGPRATITDHRRR